MFAPVFGIVYEFLPVPTLHSQGSPNDAHHSAGAAQGQTVWKTQPGLALHQVGLGQKIPGCGSLKDRWGLEEAKAEREASSDPGEEDGEELPPHRGEGVLGDRRA